MNYKMINFKEPLLLCVSGGVDSMALLYKTVEYVKMLKKNRYYVPVVHVIHVNHGISDNANHWENFVKEEANKINKNSKFNWDEILEKRVDEINKCFNKTFDHDLLKFKSFKLNLKANDEKLTEQYCREKRYELILDYCVENKIQQVLTAHHKDDLYENNFISIFKNRIYSFSMLDENVKEWKGEKIKCLKPLLNSTKKELEQYLIENGISHIHDESNEVSDNIRNLLRNHLFKNLSLLKNHDLYLTGMERFFELMNFSFNFYTNIIKNKILTQIGFGKHWKNGIEKTVYSLPVKVLLPYIENVNYFLNKENNSILFEQYKQDEKFLIEVLNLFFQSKTGYYLTGKHKKFLKNNLQNICVKEKEMIILDDNQTYFSVEFNLFNSSPEMSIEEKILNLEKSYFNFVVYKK